MLKLWSRTWFQRVWTVQEFIHPPKVLLICGGRCLTARTFDYCEPASMTLMVDLFELDEHAKFVILDVIERTGAEF